MRLHALQRSEPANEKSSILNFYRKLIALRRSENALAAGAYQELASGANLFAYIRGDGMKRFLAALNFGNDEEVLKNVSGTLAISTLLDREGERVTGKFKLRPNEGIVVELD